jgi:site-specific DNA-methyltransferase (cytosine-N4-specific)
MSAGRCTKSHEYLFLLTKSARYYYDAEAIKEPATCDRECGTALYEQVPGGGNNAGLARNYRTAGNKTHKTVTEYERSDTEEHRTAAGLLKIADTPYAQRNKRDVWTVSTQPYKEAHFATFPEALVEPCILAGSKPRDVVLDPFCGSGTTGVVALLYHRDFVGIELNPTYAGLAQKRIGEESPMFNQVEVIAK